MVIEGVEYKKIQDNDKSCRRVWPSIALMDLGTCSTSEKDYQELSCEVDACG